MPYKIPANPSIQPNQKRIRLTWFKPCSCGGEYRVYVRLYRKHLCKIRCRKCRDTQTMPVPEQRHITVAEWEAETGIRKEV